MSAEIKDPSLQTLQSLRLHHVSFSANRKMTTRASVNGTDLKPLSFVVNTPHIKTKQSHGRVCLDYLTLQVYKNSTLTYH